MGEDVDKNQIDGTAPPNKNEFVEQGILWPDGAEWIWHEPSDSPQYILAIKEVHNHHFALVLGDPDGTFDCLETFHDSDDQFLRYPPGGDDV